MKGQLIRIISFPIQRKNIFEKESAKFLLFLFILATVSYTLLIIKLAQFADPLDLFIKFLDLITVTVPPGLPVSMTFGIIFALEKMKQKQIFCTSPNKTIVGGMINMLCFDKTGTLTEDFMDFNALISTKTTISQNQQRTVTFAEPIRNQPNHNLMQISKSNPHVQFALTNMATNHTIVRLNATGQNVGDPMEVKMFEFGQFQIKDTENHEILMQFQSTRGHIGQAVRRFQFDSELFRMSTITKSTVTKDDYYLYIKGSPEIMTNIYDPSTVPKNYHQMLKKYTCMGFRVLAIGHRPRQGEGSQTRETRPGKGHRLRRLRDLREQTQARDQGGAGGAERSADPLRDDHRRQRPHCLQHRLRVSHFRRDQEGLHLPLGGRPLHAGEVPRAPAGAVRGGQEVRDGRRNRPVHRPVQRTTVPDGQGLQPHLRQPLRAQPRIVQGAAELRQGVRQGQAQRQGQSHQHLPGTRQDSRMCGDGANDCGALKQAEIGLSLSQAEASISAPFTSQITNISSMVELIKECRAGLATNYSLFNIMAIYSLIQYNTVVIQQFFFAYPGDFHFLYWDVLGNFIFFLTLGYTGTAKKLTVESPNCSLFTISNLTQLMITFIIQMGGQVLMINGLNYYGQDIGYTSQLTYEEFLEDDYEFVMDSFESNILFLFANFMYVFTLLSFSISRPWRKQFYTNIPFTIILVLVLALSTVVIMVPQFRPEFMELSRVDYHPLLVYITLIAWGVGIFICILQKFLLEPFFNKRSNRRRAQQLNQ